MGTEPERRASAGAVACTTEQSALGEGVRWDAARAELLRVDILRGRVHRDLVRDDGTLLSVCSYDLPWPVGMVAPVHGETGWLLAAGRGFVHLAVDGTWHPVAEEVSPPGTRMNDGACDPQGRLWAGSLADDHRRGGGAFYRLDQHGRVDRVLDGLTIPNGVGWSPEGTTLYLVDSIPGVVLAHDFDGERGTIADGRVLVAVDPDLGAPDGLTVDAAGDLWVAVYGGGRVHHYAPDGELLEAFVVPAPQVTSCGFAGPGLDRLYVTTATEDYTEERRRAEPHAGLVYRLDVGVVGRPASPFRPDPRWWRTVTAATDPPGGGAR